AIALVRALGSAPAVSEAPAVKSPEMSGRRPAPARSASAPALPHHPSEATGTVRGRVEVPTGEPVAYVYVENLRAPAVRERRVIKQVDKQFVPRWAVVQTGTAIEFPNLDNIYHNVFSLSTGNAFDLGLYSSGTEGKAKVFTEPGAVDVYCNIH